MTAHNRDSDVIIIGGGHNGLACAGYLAEAGKSVRLCEARDIRIGNELKTQFSNACFAPRRGVGGDDDVARGPPSGCRYRASEE